ncbi:hypothetical protein LINPERHAP1_LOCUS19047, partial [Linum perenne]
SKENCNRGLCLHSFLKIDSPYTRTTFSQDTTISTVFQHRRTQPRLSKATTNEPTNKKKGRRIELWERNFSI